MCSKSTSSQVQRIMNTSTDEPCSKVEHGMVTTSVNVVISRSLGAVFIPFVSSSEMLQFPIYDNCSFIMHVFSVLHPIGQTGSDTNLKEINEEDIE